jgi:hypothetical protein
MDIEYYSTWDGEKGIRRFYATMILQVEQPDVGQTVSMYLALQPTEEPGKHWDVVRCRVPYDGNVNLPYRYYEVSDHWSETAPYYGGEDESLPVDKV